MIRPQELLLIVALVSFTCWAPFTKVEESFNLHAIHDILTFGVQPSSLEQYDHLEFPGVVPRTFVGALVISFLAYVPTQALSLLDGVRAQRSLDVQILVRLILGLCNACALIALGRRIRRVHEATTSNFFLAFQGTQFHIMYYASRTLPNMFALPMTTISTIYLLDESDNVYNAVSILTVAALLFRAEISILLFTTVSWHLFITRRLALYRTLKIGIISSTSSLIVSFAIDSYFWRFAVVPELSGFYFNAIEGKSSAWGVSPVYQYLIDIPKLLLNPAVTILLLPLSIVISSNARNLVIPALTFVGIYSAQPHKEWRFIVYIVPQLTYTASLAAACIFNRRSKHVLIKLITVGIMVSIAATGLLSLAMLMVSSMNYPGGEAMYKIATSNSISNGPVYLDVTTCMTGSTKFIQVGRPFVRTENATELKSVAFWEGIEAASVADSEQIDAIYKAAGQRSSWQVQDKVYAFDHMDWSRLQIIKTPKLFIMRNEHYNRKIRTSRERKYTLVNDER